MDFRWTDGDTAPVLAGTGGAVFRVLMLDQPSPWRAVGVAMSGALVGAFGVPGLAEWMGVSAPGVRTGMAFVAGMYGLQIAKLIQGQIDQWGPRVIGDTMNRWRGGPPEPPQEGPR